MQQQRQKKLTNFISGNRQRVISIDYMICYHVMFLFPHHYYFRYQTREKLFVFQNWNWNSVSWHLHVSVDLIRHIWNSTCVLTDTKLKITMATIATMSPILTKTDTSEWHTHTHSMTYIKFPIAVICISNLCKECM